MEVSMRFGIGFGLLAVFLSISPGVVAQEQEESPSPARKASPEAGPSEGGSTAPGKSKFERPGRRFGGDQGMPPDMGDFPIEDYDEGPIDEPHPDAGAVAPAPVPDSTMDYLAAIGTLALAFAVVTAAAVMRVRRVLSADAAFKLIALSLIVVAGLSLLRSRYAPELMAPMMVVLGTSLGFIFGKQMGSTVPEETHSESPPVATPPA
jgi:hypothetical protein